MASEKCIEWPSKNTHLPKTSNQDRAKMYLNLIRTDKPSYIRDQLQIILRHIKNEDQLLIDQALTECIHRDLYSATDLADMINYLKRHRRSAPEKEQLCQKINLFEHPNHFLYDANTPKRDIN